MSAPPGYTQPAIRPQPRMNVPQAPYQAGAGYRERSQSFAPARVIYDRTVVTDHAYFDRSCGVLLAVADGSLTFTSGCGEPPYVIPSAEILDLGLNLEVGRDAGVFHIATRRGLYLQLALESASREESAALVDSLRKQLGLAVF